MRAPSVRDREGLGARAPAAGRQRRRRRIRPFVSLVDALDRRLTPAGRLVLVLTAFAAGFGVDTTLSLGYQVFAFGAAAFVVAIAGTWGLAIRVRAERHAGTLATVGELFTYEVELANPGDEPIAGLMLRDRLTLGDGRRAPRRVAAPSRLRWLARSSLLRRQERRWRRGGTIRETAVPEIPARGHARVTLAFVPERRGKVRFERVTVFRSEPLGLARSAITLDLPGALTVLPPRFPVARIQLPGTRRLQQGGVANAGKVGDSEEFLGLRDYRPGDSLKRIHWPTWARVGRPVVRENEDEFFVRHGLVLDTFCSEADARQLDAAASVAASLAVNFDTTDTLLDLVLVEDRTYHLTAGRGLGDVAALLEVIADARPAPAGHFAALAATTRDLVPVSSGLVLVLLDWNAERIALVEEVLRLGAACVVFLVLPAGRPAPASLAQAGTQVHVVRADHVREDLARV
jgi:uncharacterized protein (DUF58 family)